MIEVTVIDWYPNQMLEVVQQLRDKGYKQGIDFDFEYHKPEQDNWSGDILVKRYTVFIFYKEELATWFSLKYQ